MQKLLKLNFIWAFLEAVKRKQGHEKCTLLLCNIFSCAQVFPLLRNPLIITATTAVLITIVHFTNRKNSRKIKFCLIPFPRPILIVVGEKQIAQIQIYTEQKKNREKHDKFIYFSTESLHLFSVLCCLMMLFVVNRGKLFLTHRTKNSQPRRSHGSRKNEEQLLSFEYQNNLRVCSCTKR